ncbi:hypothetical protein GCM10009111_00660 [Colwellia asteriadis]|uniref:PEP-CTERM protein-sorting domain-containing protein n=1 Tax=Colwellia asteriadis TaxID=517723 RepID=A0ABP3WES1_9GAMM
MLKSILISLITLSSLVNFANAGIISGNAIPSSLEVNSNPESDTDIFLYAERQNVMLGADLDVDFLAATGLSGSLLAGTTVNSFIFNYDAVGTDYSRGSFNATGTHFFDTKILAVIWTGSRPGAQPQTAKNLGKSDSVLGVAGVTYPTDFLGRGLELEADFYGANGTNDVFTVSGNQIDLSLFARAPYSDQLRVITAAKVEVPEPAAIVLFGTALCLFGFRRFSK